MKAGIVQKIFADHYPLIEASRPLSRRERRAAENILTCRTPAQGYHVDHCPNDDYRIIRDNSCKHRACPQCGSTETEIWIERQVAKELRCPHHQIVFTIPHALHPLWRWNRKLFTNLMFQAAWHTLRELLGDRRRQGTLPGVTAVFQSWGDELQEHVHLHFIVTSGGLNARGQWIAGPGEYLLPVPVVASKFRGKFLDYLSTAFKPETARGRQKSLTELLGPPPESTREKCLALLSAMSRIPWHVQIEPAYDQARSALKYIGRYIRRGPLSEKRILGYDGHTVTIAYAHPEKHAKPFFQLPAAVFVSRLLTHVPEPGTHCARVYGLYQNVGRKQLNRARAQLGQPPYQPESQVPDTHELLHRMFPDFTGDLCPNCRARLITVTVVRPGRSPPVRQAA